MVRALAAAAVVPLPTLPSPRRRCRRRRPLPPVPRSQLSAPPVPPKCRTSPHCPVLRRRLASAIQAPRGHQTRLTCLSVTALRTKPLSTTATKDLLVLSSFLGFCGSVWNVRAAAQTVGGAPVSIATGASPQSTGLMRVSGLTATAASTASIATPTTTAGAKSTARKSGEVQHDFRVCALLSLIYQLALLWA